MTATKRPVPVKRKHRIGEVVGGTAAECTAVCCCCPCAVVHFMVMAVYTVPKGLLKKAVIKMRKRHRSIGNSNSNSNSTTNNDVVLIERQREEIGNEMLEEKESMEDVVALESEMWARFTGTGFWRSESQRKP